MLKQSKTERRQELAEQFVGGEATAYTVKSRTAIANKIARHGITPEEMDQAAQRVAKARAAVPQILADAIEYLKEEMARDSWAECLNEKASELLPMPENEDSDAEAAAWRQQCIAMNIAEEKITAALEGLLDSPAVAEAIRMFPHAAAKIRKMKPAQLQRVLDGETQPSTDVNGASK